MEHDRTKITNANKLLETLRRDCDKVHDASHCHTSRAISHTSCSQTALTSPFRPSLLCLTPHTSHYTLHTTHYTLHTTHYTLHTQSQ